MVEKRHNQLLPCQFWRARLSLLKTTPRCRKQRILVINRGIALGSYKYLIWNFLFWCKFHIKLSDSFNIWMGSKHVSNSFHTSRRGPNKALQKEISRSTWLRTCAIVTNWYLTTQYGPSYCTIRGVPPSQASSWNLTLEPSQTVKVPYWKKNSLAFIRPDVGVSRQRHRMTTVVCSVGVDDDRSRGQGEDNKFSQF